MSTTSEAALAALDRFVGTWTTEASHPALPGVVVHGSAVMEWLEGKQFLIQRARTDHPNFPDSISIIGYTDRDRVDAAPSSAPAGDAQLCMHYFDSRGVFRVYEASADAESLRFSRLAPGFSQRFTGTFAGDGASLVGRWQVCEDGARWQDDMEISYRRTR